jgi:CheY-like chemotaxis protein
MKREVRVLIIEDKEEDWTPLVEEFGKFDAAIEHVIAPTALEAHSEIDAGGFDVVVCDLKIPSGPGLLDADPEHGRAVFQSLQDALPGTPVIVFSGHATSAMIPDFVNVARKVDVLGRQSEIQMVQFFFKDQLAECLEALRELIEGFYRLEDIVISTGPHNLDLTADQKRVLRIYGSRLGASMIDVSALGGGLSGAKSVRVEVKDGRGARKSLVAAKLSRIEGVRREAGRYDQLSGLMPPGAGAALVGSVQDGAAGTGGLFFQMADGHVPLFALLKVSEDGAIEALSDLRAKLDVWHENAPADQRQISELRRILLRDDQFDDFVREQDRPQWQDTDALTVFVTPCIQHCDLHGFNVLVDTDRSAVLIDYGEVADAVAALDPVTIELSTIFHPDAKDLMPGWPDVSQTKKWADLDSYVEGCPFAKFIQACREWAHEVAASDQEVYACGFVYAVRQLKYGNALASIAVGIADAASAALL